MKKKLLFCFLSIILAFPVFSQMRTVTGTVLDSAGIALPGATVKVKGTSRGASTGVDGKFSILSGETDVLIVSAIGFQSKEIKVGNLSVLRITLQEDNQSLNEVVVVGYGKQKKVSLTGSIASVGTKELTQSPVANLSNALAGRLPGLITLQNSGEPGFDGTQLWIRGMATFTGSQNPLILVDGVERSFSGIDPNEIGRAHV